MAKQYIYPAINPIWMNPVKTFNPIYNNLPFDFQQPQKPYAQKAKRGLPTTVQVLSDWEPEFKVYEAESGILIDTITGATPLNGILNETFTLYEFTINWNDYDAGFYYLESHYTNDDPLLKVERSGLIQTADNFSQTVVVQYTNSTNDFSAIFSTGIVYNLVVEGNIEDYTPAFEDIIYNDQDYNATKLNSIPHREFTFYVGSNRSFAGIPPYIADKLNWAFACDQIQLDGVYYQNTNGSKWEVKRSDQLAPNFIGLEIKIIEVINRYLQSYTPGELPVNSVKVVDRVLDYLNNSADIAVVGIFTQNSVLTKIIIYNLGRDVFTINASTAADGSTPIAPPFTTTGAAIDVWVIDEPFDAIKTLYLLGLTGTNCNIFIRYDQLDAPYILPPTSNKPFVKGTRYSYEEVTVGDFAIDWNVGTGEGNAGTKFEGCVISGTNGTKDMNGLKEIGWDSSQPLTRDLLTGNVGNTVTLVKANLPNYDLNTDGAIRYKHGTAQNGGNPTQGLSSVNQNGEFNIPLGGSSQPLDISDRARVTLMFVCITN